MGSSANCTADNVERVIWDDVLGTSVTIVVQAYAFTKQDAEQAFAVAWNIQAEIASAN